MRPMPASRFPDPATGPVPRATTARRRGMPLGRVLGVELVLDRSWFVIAVLTVLMYGPVLWRLYPGLGWLNLVLALGFAVGLALSVLVHELAHALAGRAAGWPVGRIVLTLMGGHTAFGAVATRPLPTALVSLVGPVSNLALAAAGEFALSFAPESAAGPVWALLQLLVLANWVLGLFNLLPGLPLDGGRVVEAVVWALTGAESRGTVAAAWCGRAIAVLVVLWATVTAQWRSPLVFAVVALVAGFIFLGAGQSLRQARLTGVLDAVRARDIARPALEFAPATPLSLVDATVTEATSHGYRGWTPDVVVRDPSRGLVGVLSPARSAEVTGGQRAHVAVGDVCVWCPQDAFVAPDAAGGHMVRLMESRQLPWLCVVDGTCAADGSVGAGPARAEEPTGVVGGVVHHEDLARYALRR